MKNSGAENRAARLEDARLRDKQEKQRGDLSQKYIEQFGTLGSAPTGDPMLALSYVQDCMLIALEQIVKDPALDAFTRWKMVKEIGAAVGMTHSKAMVQKSVAVAVDKIVKKKETAREGTRSLQGIRRKTDRSGAAGVERVDAPARSDAGPETQEDQ